MKNKLDIGTIKGLESIKKSLNEVIDRQIDEKRINNQMENLASIPFISQLRIFEGLTESLYNTSEGKKVLCKCAKIIKENECLRNEYTLYRLLNNAHSINNVPQFLSEALSIIGKRPNGYGKALNTFATALKECIKCSGVNSAKFEELLTECKDQYHCSVNALLSEGKNLKNLAKYTENFNRVVSEVEAHQICETNDTTTIENATDIMNGIHHISEGLEPWESDVIKDISLCTLSGKSHEEMFNEYKTSCIEKLNESADASEDKELKNRILTMKEQLENKIYNQDSFIVDLFNLRELKETLN